MPACYFRWLSPGIFSEAQHHGRRTFLARPARPSPADTIRRRDSSIGTIPGCQSVDRAKGPGLSAQNTMHYDQLFPRCSPVHTGESFTNFRRLPAEIRNMIWEFALPEPRVYEVLDAPNAKQKTPAHQGLMFANVHQEPPPALAAVCRESRYFVLHHYKPLTLGTTTKFVDMSRDILLLEPYLLVKRLHRTLHFMSQILMVRDNVTRLALGTSYGVYQGIFHPVLGRKVSKNNMVKLLTNLAKFPRLKTLVFIVHQEFQFEFDFRFPGTMTPMPKNYHLLLPPPASNPTHHALSSAPGLGTNHPSPAPTAAVGFQHLPLFFLFALSASASTPAPPVSATTDTAINTALAPPAATTVLHRPSSSRQSFNNPPPNPHRPAPATPAASSPSP
ncbi:hypothetical protein VTK26DRAFT_3932 [Humicola hyalothermophila]